MSAGVVALVVALLLLVARAPWTGGRAARLAVVARGCGGGSDVAAAARIEGRVPATRAGPGVDVVLVLDLLDVAVASGAALPRAVEAVGVAVGGPDGAALVTAARSLVLGAGWPGAWAGAPVHLAPVVDCLADSWESGAAPGPRLRAAADDVTRARRRAAREAAGRLGVRLVLPLGLCLLPAFVLLGLVPVVLSLAGGLLG